VSLCCSKRVGLADNRSTSLHRQMHELLESYLRHKSDMVNYEAARAICEMRSITAQELNKPIAGRPTFPFTVNLSWLTF
jgi:hypothetical protein